MSRKTPTAKTATPRLLTERNRIRGLIGSIKGAGIRAPSGKSAYPKDANRALQFQRSLAAALIKSRELLATGQFESFLAWMEAQTSAQLVGLTQISTASPELLREVLGSHPLPLAKEIHWIVARLTLQQARLRQFVAEADRLESLYWAGDWVAISAQLDHIEGTLGRSLWVIEARIVLEQEFVGLESQKRVVATERRAGPRSLAAYIAHHLSVRNEPTTDLTRFRTDLTSRTDRLGIAEPLRSFLRLRLLDQDPRTDAQAAQVLQIAQSLSEIDLYDTLLRVCRSRLVAGSGEARAVAVGAALVRLRTIGDRQVDRVLSILSSPGTNEPSNSPVPGQPIGVKAALRHLAAEPRNVAIGIAVAGQIASTRVAASDPSGGPRWPWLIRRMVNVLRFDSAYDSELADLEKYLSNRRVFGTSAECWLLFRSEIDGIDIGEVGPSLLTHPSASILGQIARRGAGQSRWFAVLSALSQLRHAIEAGDVGTVIERIVKLRLHDAVPISALPLRAALSTARWKQLRTFRGSLALAIALHLCWRATDSDLAATNLRFAYEEFLDSHALASPADLLTHSARFDRQELVYFLREICVAVVMDMSHRIKTSIAVEEMRSQVCSVLCELDPDNRDEYQAEIVSIVHSQSLAEGQTLVDSSRVHVDTESIRAWASRTLEADLQRYDALVKSGIGVAQDLEVILRNVQAASQQIHYLEVPDSEADNILVEMMISLRQQFLLDPRHGLDSYLSRRVRHHSMTGYLRGPVEEAKLITSRNTRSGRYAENVYWLDRLKANGSLRAVVSRSFEVFAEDFDRVVIGLKNDLFHVNSVDHPKGIFEVQLTAPMIHLGRSALQTNVTADVLCAVCFSLFWANLDPSLKAAQRHLRQDAKRETSTAFQRLRASLRRALERESYDDASIAIASASENVQREIDHMAEWFVRREVQQTRQLYSIGKVLEISIASALASHRPFEHEIAKHVECGFFVRTGDLVVIAEVVLTALGNVKAHAGRHRSSVSVSLQNESADAIVLRIENTVSTDAISAQAKERIDLIRQEIDDGTYVARIRSEGGSGLMKMAATVQQSQHGRIEFGFEGSKFYVEIALAFILEQGSEPGVTCGRLVG